MRGICQSDFPASSPWITSACRSGAAKSSRCAARTARAKSTLMKILGGVYQPDAGEILIDGQPVKIQNVTDSMKLGIAFIHQELNVLDNLDVAANVFLGREPKNALGLIDSRKIHADTEPFLKRLGLDISTRTRLDELSIAQQQMVEIAKALSLNSRLIIMDEPTSSLTLRGNEPPAGTRRRIERAGRQHHLYFAPSWRNFQMRRPRRRVARRQKRRRIGARPRPRTTSS